MSSQAHPNMEDRLSIVVIGAGLCGLGAAIALRLAGHAVTVLESVSALEEVGAGLQITPNGTRILRAWGVDSSLISSGATTVPTSFSMNRYNGRPLARRLRYGEELENRYGSPLWCLHRVDLQRALADRAVALGAIIRLGMKVVHVDADQGRVELQSGERMEGDLVVAAGGLWSTAREALFDGGLSGAVPKPLPTGDLAYRIVLDRDVLQDAEVRAKFEEPGIHIWVGAGSHVVAYSMRGGRYINLVLLVRDDLPAHVAKAEGSVDEMHALFEGWDPILARMLQLTNKALKWRLHHLPPMPRWTTASARFVVGGDCAHAMLPYMAQGANSSLEDAATFGSLLARVCRRDQLAPALALYDEIRRPRVDRLVQETFAQGKEHHLSDGEEQKLRDEGLARSMMDEYGPDSDSPWIHPKIQSWVYGYDAYAEAQAAFEKSPF